MKKKVLSIVQEYVLSHIDKTTPIPEFEIFEVWHCYILGHEKWLISTTLPDGMYYEVTYNSIKKELYLDAYKKFGHNCTISVND